MNGLKSLSRIYKIAVIICFQIQLLFAIPGINTFKKTFYAPTYIAHYLAKNWIMRPSYTQEYPIIIPETLPDPVDLAQTIHEHMGDSFMCGASTSAHQCGSLCTPAVCSWSRYAQDNNLALPSDDRYAMNWDKYYTTYIDDAVEKLHLTALRFSIEWPLVQPTEHEWNYEILHHYAEMFIYMIQKGVTPMVCFHHYTDPNWFLDKGGFEHEDNIHYFVKFCSTVYEHIMHKVMMHNESREMIVSMKQQPLWATYNAPEGYAFRGYYQHGGPPSQPGHMGLAVVAQVLKNELEAHVQVYHAIKKIHNEQWYDMVAAPQIGFLKNIHQIDPAKDTWYHYAASPLTRLISTFADMIQNGSIYQFFTKGIYHVHVPCCANIQHINKDAIGTLDFIGLNYYANRHMHITNAIQPTDESLCSDNIWYYRYPQGMYRAIIELSEHLARPLNIPLFVAENGIATKDDAKRARFYHEYLYAIACAVKDGYKVYGYLPWTLADNYEWPSKNQRQEKEYGLCRVHEDYPDRLEVKEGTARSYGLFTQAMATYCTS